MDSAIRMDSPTSAVSVFTGLMLLWTMFLIHDARARRHALSLLKCLGLLLHNIPTICLLITSVTAQMYDDSALVWFIFLMAFRYWRILMNIFFWLQYKPTLTTEKDVMTAADCTVIISIVGPIGHNVFAEMVAAILVNGPACLVFSKNTEDALKQVEDFLPTIIMQLEAGVTTYQLKHGLAGIDIVTKIQVNNAHISNKRAQVVDAFEKVGTGT